LKKKIGKFEKKILAMRFLLFSLLLLFAMGSCKKKNITYIVEETVTDNSFAQPLSGATVKLYKASGSNFIQGTLVETITTGSDGKYRFDIKRDKTEAYVIVVEKDNYFGTSSNLTQENLDPDKSNARNYAIYAKSWVKLRFVNLNPVQSDVLQYIRQNGKSQCEECCPGGDQFLYGDVDTSIYCINDGNTTYSYYYWVLNTPVNGPKSIVTVPFDTVELLLNY
jgi:5-hydroxyisourate hydrolase-like protein (transthyretin family)